MTYLDYLNNFNLIVKDNRLSPTAQLFYFRLLMMFNERHWPDGVSIDIPRIMEMCGASKSVTQNALKQLLEANLISYEKGHKSKPNTYHLLPGGYLETQDCEIYKQPISQPINNPKDSLEAVQNTASKSDESLSHIKIKIEDKEEDIITPPKSPSKPKAKKVSKVNEYTPEFERFWKEYPAYRRTNKPTAFESWQGALETGADPETIILAVKVLSKTPTWTEEGGRYTKLPSTWLNQHGWEDVLQEDLDRQRSDDEYWANPVMKPDLDVRTYDPETQSIWDLLDY